MELRTLSTWSCNKNGELDELVDPAWSDDESSELSDYLEFGTVLGYPISTAPTCTMCDFRLPQMLILTDGLYEWSQILFHYVRVHKVHLPDPIVFDMLSRLHELQDANHVRAL